MVRVFGLEVERPIDRCREGAERNCRRAEGLKGLGRHLLKVSRSMYAVICQLACVDWIWKENFYVVACAYHKRSIGGSGALALSAIIRLMNDFGGI